MFCHKASSNAGKRGLHCWVKLHILQGFWFTKEGEEYSSSSSEIDSTHCLPFPPPWVFRAWASLRGAISRGEGTLVVVELFMVYVRTLCSEEFHSSTTTLQWPCKKIVESVNNCQLQGIRTPPVDLARAPSFVFIVVYITCLARSMQLAVTPTECHHHGSLQSNSSEIHTDSRACL